MDDKVSGRAEEILRYISPWYGITLEEWDYDRDHVHVMFRAQPKSELSKFINAYKSASSWLIKKNIRRFGKGCGRMPSGARVSACLLSAGGAPIETIRAYIEGQGDKYEQGGKIPDLSK